jgi:hypothetical protein
MGNRQNINCECEEGVPERPLLSHRTLAPMTAEFCKSRALCCVLPVKAEAALMPASSHSASHPNQDSYAQGDSESDQRAVLDLAGHPVQSVVADLGAELGGFVAETRGLVAGQTPAAANAIGDFGHGRGDGVTDTIPGRRHASRGVPAGRSSDSFQLVLKGA